MLTIVLRMLAPAFSPYFSCLLDALGYQYDAAFISIRQVAMYAFSKSRHVDRLKKRLDYAHDKAKSFSEEDTQRSKDRYDRKAICFLRT